MLLFSSAEGQASFGNNDWSPSQAESRQNEATSEAQEASQADSSSADSDIVSVEDGFKRGRICGLS